MKKSIAILVTLILGLNMFGQHISAQKLEKKIDELLESYVYYNRFTGNVLISQHNEIIYKKSFGYADLETLKKNTDKSIFSIASLTKSLTAVGIMNLVENGKLNLDTPISQYFPGFMPDYSKQITIKHLLNHSSGIEANIGRIDHSGNGLMPTVNEIKVEELFHKFKESNLRFEPGTDYEYNNFGYYLLANIIEKVSGLPYSKFMEHSVFRPANMNSTASANFINESYRAIPYSGLGKSELAKLNYAVHTSWLKGAGEINSTTIDLFNFMQALEKGVVLKPENVDKLYSLTQNTGMNEMSSGLGWMLDHKEGERWIYNTGLLPGYASVMGSLPDKNTKIIILSNATSVNPMVEEFQGKISFVEGEITDKIISILLGKSIEILPWPWKLNENQVKATKTYQLDDKHSIIFRKEGNNYSLETAGKNPWSVFSYAFSRDIRENNPAISSALIFANAMSTQNFEGLSGYGNEDMKKFLDSPQGLNQLKGMWDNFLRQAGPFRAFNIYKIEGDEVKNVHIRFHFETFDVGIVVSINNSNEIQGLFMDDAIKTSHVSKVTLIPIAENKFFINGHQYEGMQDLIITVSDTELIISDDSKVFRSKVTSSS